MTVSVMSDCDHLADWNAGVVNDVQCDCASMREYSDPRVSSVRQPLLAGICYRSSMLGRKIPDAVRLLADSDAPHCPTRFYDLTHFLVADCADRIGPA